MMFMTGRHSSIWSISLLIVLLGLSVAARFPLLDYESQDYRVAVSSWYSFIKDKGPAEALTSRFEYNIPYYYILALSTYLPFKAIYSAKISSIVFDYVAAWWMYKLVRLKYPSGQLPWVAFLAVIFAPTVIINSSMWAQADVIYASFLLGSLYFMIKLARSSELGYKRVAVYGGMVLGMFALALSIKLQAVFFVLPILFMLVSRILPWYVWLTAPLVYIVTLLPSKWLGASWYDLFYVYVDQLDTYKELTLNAPSVYGFIPNAPGEIIAQVGIILTAAVVTFVAWILSNRRVSFSEGAVLRIALLSALMIPYLLPHMHERYFFVADMVALVFAFYFPRYWYVAVVVLGVSLFSYAHITLGGPVVKLEMLSLALGLIILLIGRDFVLNELLAKRRTKLSP